MHLDQCLWSLREPLPGTRSTGASHPPTLASWEWDCIDLPWLPPCLEMPRREPLPSEEAISSSMMPPIECTWN